MRVHDSNLNAVTIGARQTGRTDTAPAGRTHAYGGRDLGGPDRVSLSDLSSAVARAAEEGPGRAERVSQLAAAYRSGAYHANPAAVAHGLVNDSIRA